MDWIRLGHESFTPVSNQFVQTDLFILTGRPEPWKVPWISSCSLQMFIIRNFNVNEAAEEIETARCYFKRCLRERGWREEGGKREGEWREGVWREEGCREGGEREDRDREREREREDRGSEEGWSEGGRQEMDFLWVYWGT